MTEKEKPEEPEGATADDLELPADEREQVKGGRVPDVCKTPVPNGPVPVPYPNA